MEQKNLLEIRMKENDSVPEVYWRGVQLDALNSPGLVDVYFHWHTSDCENDTQFTSTIDYFEDCASKDEARVVSVMIDREGANGKFHLASDDAEINPLLDADRY